MKGMSSGKTESAFRGTAAPRETVINEIPLWAWNKWAASAEYSVESLPT